MVQLSSGINSEPVSDVITGSSNVLAASTVNESSHTSPTRQILVLLTDFVIVVSGK